MKAPYESTHVRIPVPIKEEVLRLAEEFRTGSSTSAQPVSQNLLTPIEAVDLARKILKQKKSARLSLQKLLTGIYGVDFEL